MYGQRHPCYYAYCIDIEFRKDNTTIFITKLISYCCYNAYCIAAITHHGLEGALPSHQFTNRGQIGVFAYFQLFSFEPPNLCQLYFPPVNKSSSDASHTRFCSCSPLAILIHKLQLRHLNLQTPIVQMRKCKHAHR